jgi:hypothetical protein
MSEKRDIAGLWWFPANPEERWVGTLTLSPEKTPRLHLTVPKGFGFQTPTVLPALHGCDQHGKPITLLHIGRSRCSTSAALSSLDYTAGYAVLGIEFPDAASFQVHSLMFGMQHLYEWGGISGFARDIVNTVDNETISYSRPKNQSFVINSDLSLEIRATHSGHQSFSEWQIKESLCFAFQSRQGLNLSQSLDLIHAIRHLLHFAILDKVFPLWINAGRSDHGYTLDNRFIPQDIEFWSSMIREPVESESLASGWIFQFRDVQLDFAKFIGEWLEYVKKYEEALDCYFGTIYHCLPHSFEHLCLTQAFEAYHGIKFESHKEQKFEDKIQEITEANKSHLKGLIDDVSEFAKTVLENRNYYTHHNPKWKENGRVVSGTNLFRLNEKLRLLFQMCILSDMGIPSDRFIRLRRQIATHVVEYT